MDEDAILGTEGDLNPGHIVLGRDPATPSLKWAQHPYFSAHAYWPKRSPISATAELLLLNFFWLTLFLAVFWYVVNDKYLPMDNAFLEIMFPLHI